VEGHVASFDLTITQRVLQTLPATLGEVASILRRDKHRINALLDWLRRQGSVKRSDRYGMRDGKRGRKPAIWVRT